MSALTKADIVLELTERVGLNKRESKEFVESFFEEIRTALEQGEDVKLSGFGQFSVRYKNARPGRNPKTGEPKEISARNVVVFRPGQKLRDQVDVLSFNTFAPPEELDNHVSTINNLTED